ncbi:MAG: PAS domain-containing protein, partial [Bacteroidia bacterium]
MSLLRPNVETVELVKQYCALFDTNPNAIIVIDPNQDPVYTNASFTQQFNDSIDELLAIEEVQKEWAKNCDTIFQSGSDELLYDKTTGIEYRTL